MGGIPAGGATQRLVRLVGVGAALEMMLTAEPITAQEGKNLSLVNRLSEPHALDEVVENFARNLAGKSPVVMHEIKKRVYYGCDLTLEEGLRSERRAIARVLASEDYAKASAPLSKNGRRFSTKARTLDNLFRSNRPISSGLINLQVVVHRRPCR